jgi:hypothetical protein
MKKNIVIAILVVAALFLVSRQCGLTEKYKLARHDYNELVAITDADKKMSDAHIAELTKAIGRADEVIGQKETEIAVKNAKITALSNRLDELVNAEPPTTPEVEAMPIVVNLRGQISKLTELFSLSQQAASLQAEEIDALKGKCVDLVSIVNHLTVQYDKEHALRLSAEKLVTSLEKRVKSQGLLGKVKTIAIVTVAGSLAYSILKKN